MKTVIQFYVGCCLLSIANSLKSHVRTRRLQLNDGKITKLVLVDAGTGQKLIDLEPGTVNTINLKGLNVTKLNVEAVVNEGLEKKVVFDNGKNENKSPYARCGNIGPSYNTCSDLVLDASVNITATSLDSSGNELSTISALVEIIDETAAPTISLVPTVVPTASMTPTITPTTVPTTSIAPTITPTTVPTTSIAPSMTPTIVPTAVPSIAPTGAPSMQPTTPPTTSAAPSMTPTITPTTVPTTSIAPSMTPTILPTAVPSIAPTGAPSMEPTTPPTTSTAPSMTPTITPTTVPTTSIAPSMTPTISMEPTNAPSGAPTTFSTTSGCGIPQFVTPWENVVEYPLKISEAQGGMIGNDFLIIGGFQDGFDMVADEIYALDTTTVTNDDATWRKMDNITSVNEFVLYNSTTNITWSGGVTHAGHVVVGRKFYLCGGYVGGDPGPATNLCLTYDHDAAPGSQWSADEIPPLPEPRAGGGMVYSAVNNTLTFSAGAVRPKPIDSPACDDFTNTWVLSLDNVGAGWRSSTDIPYLANHVGFVTAYDNQGNERHFFLGGHEGADKMYGNLAVNYEWNAQSETWIQRASMPIPIGHFSSSTRPVGCGFIIAAGSTNVDGKIREVYYYDIPSDSWTLIGELPIDVNTPVCDFDPEGWFYCATGPPGRKVSWRRKVEVSPIVPTIAPTIVPTSSAAPTTAPTITPTAAPTVSSSPTMSATTVAPASTPSGCGLPEFDGPWENVVEYPLKISEAQGGMIGNDFLIIGGFQDGFDMVADEIYALDTTTVTNDDATWRKMDNITSANEFVMYNSTTNVTWSGGVTHAGHVVVGRKFYLCGGYVGGDPGPATNLCLTYDHDAAPGSQWSADEIPPLPEPRAGGGMVYSAVNNTLTFSAGAVRPKPIDSPACDDFNNTWVLSLDNVDAGWRSSTDIPYLANHVGFVTAYDDQGNERHFFLGGHEGADKVYGNLAVNYEWNAQNETWIQRASMPIPIGHFSSSTRAFGCGFIIAAGSTNVDGKIREVYYYDIPSDSWTSIGELPIDVNTPVCDFDAEGWFYCATGPPGRKVSWRRKMKFANLL